jgi:hypothetical protein
MIDGFMFTNTHSVLLGHDQVLSRYILSLYTLISFTYVVSIRVANVVADHNDLLTQ